MGSVSYEGKEGKKKLALYFPYYPFNLLQRIRSSTAFPLSQRYAIADGFLNGLAGLHSKDIVHSDIKLENILVSGSDVVLIDFGYSFTRTENEMRTKNCGTTLINSPEIANAIVNHLPLYVFNDFCKDLWAAGIVLYQLFRFEIRDHNFCEKMDPILFIDFDCLEESRWHSAILNRLNDITEENWLREPAKDTIQHIIYSLMRFGPGERISAREAQLYVHELRHAITESNA